MVILLHTDVQTFMIKTDIDTTKKKRKMVTAENPVVSLTVLTLVPNHNYLFLLYTTTTDKTVHTKIQIPKPLHFFH